MILSGFLKDLARKHDFRGGSDLESCHEGEIMLTTRIKMRGVLAARVLAITKIKKRVLESNYAFFGPQCTF